MMLVTVFTAFNPADAQVIRSRLEASQFHPVVTHELSALSLDGYALAAGGILVQVPDEEAADARELIAMASQPESPEAAEPPEAPLEGQ
jgi:putative signal transducing protein